MHPTLLSIKSELEQLASTVKTSVPNNEPLNVAHNNWSFPGTTRDELVQIADHVVELIDARGGDTLETNETLLADYPRRIAYLRANTVAQIWGSAAGAVPCYVLTLDGLRRALEPAFGVQNAEATEAARDLKRLTKQLRAIEARITDLDPRSASLSAMVGRIEQAHEAADQLPTDLATLQETRDRMQTLMLASTKDHTMVESVLEEVRAGREAMNASAREADAIISRCDDAYRAQTSEGLASAFAQRSRSLAGSMWVWVGGLVAALVVGAILGSRQLQNLSDLLKTGGQHDSNAIWINLVLALLSIGGPVWFAWISTKQVGQRFRLAEDYGYKASISKAYEGYRREAEDLSRIDPSFQARLFSSALTRLEELPLRLVETHTHGSPWHELLSSDLVRDAVKTVPGFVDRVSELAKSTLSVYGKDKKSVPITTEIRSTD